MGRVVCISRRFLGLVACAWLGACGGVPSADPPDFLPTPTITIGPESGPSTGPGIESVGPIEIKGEAGAVEGDADLWIVNLDAASDAPQIIAPNADGSFRTEVNAEVGDRIRILSRTDDAHSLPLDLEAVRGLSMAALAPLPDQGIDCVSVTPAGELDLGKARSRTEQFTVVNNCAQTVNVVRSALRFGDSNFVLEAPTAIAAGARVEIGISLEGALEGEVWDILLLDLESQNERGRYALSLWAR